MNVGQLLNPNITTASPEDLVTDILGQMESTGQQTVPIIKDNHFLGMVTESQLLDLPNELLTLKELPPQFEQAFVREHQHFLDVLRACKINHSDLTAVLGDQSMYLGSVGLQDIAQVLSGGYSIQSPGSTLVISLYERDYSLAQIARLAESNGVKILHSFIDTDPENALKILLTLRFNQVDPSRVIATLERFGYNIKEQYGEIDAPSIDQDRLDMLLKYLNI
jgi:acetoin utilization protein AcuB